MKLALICLGNARLGTMPSRQSKKSCIFNEGSSATSCSACVNTAVSKHSWPTVQSPHITSSSEGVLVLHSFTAKDSYKPCYCMAFYPAFGLCVIQQLSSVIQHSEPSAVFTSILAFANTLSHQNLFRFFTSIMAFAIGTLSGFHQHFAFIGHWNLT